MPNKLASTTSLSWLGQSCDLPTVQLDGFSTDKNRLPAKYWESKSAAVCANSSIDAESHTKSRLARLWSRKIVSCSPRSAIQRSLLASSYSLSKLQKQRAASLRIIGTSHQISGLPLQGLALRLSPQPLLPVRHKVSKISVIGLTYGFYTDCIDVCPRSQSASVGTAINFVRLEWSFVSFDSAITMKVVYF